MLCYTDSFCCFLCFFLFSCCCLALELYCCFFFFKQKTAYEMRISDWSSDVCSSDLLLRESNKPVVCTAHGKFDLQRDENELRSVYGVEWIHESKENLFVSTRATVDVNEPEQPIVVPNMFIHEIGRAPCRESVCKYV